MTKMNCKGEGCGVEIDYDKNRNPRAIEIATRQQHICATFTGKRKDEKGNVDARVKRLEERLENVETAVKALVATSGGQETLG